MPRWYALCNGCGINACQGCRRLADHHPTAREDRQQAWVGPDLVGEHCRNFIELPPRATPAPAAQGRATR